MIAAVQAVGEGVPGATRASVAAFGAGVAPTRDEFALILRLQDVCWTPEGRLSVNAAIVALCAGLLIILGFSPTGTGLTGAVAAEVGAATILIDAD